MIWSFDEESGVWMDDVGINVAYFDFGENETF